MAPALTDGQPALPAGAVLNSVVATPADTLLALRQVHDALAAGDAPSGSEVGAQMLLATLLVRYPEPVDWPNVYADVAPVAEAYPLRALALVCDPAAASSPRPVQVGLIARQLADGSTVTRGELILAALNARAHAESASLAAGWAAAGVPLIVWWQGPAPADDHLFEELAGLADRIVVDSGRVDSAATALHTLAARLGGDMRARVSDAQWRRLVPWRQCLAQLFDPPAQRSDLADLRRCSIDTDGTPGGVAAALVIAGWLASRLAWRPRQPALQGANTWRLDAGSGDVELAITASGGAAESVVRVALATVDAEYSAELAGPEDIVTAVSRVSGAATRNVVRRPRPTPDRIWLEELTSDGADAEIFENAVAVACDLVAPTT